MDFSDDEWGDDPDWLIEQRAVDAAKKGDDSDDWADTEARAMGAQHVLLLLDCSRPSMWRPCIVSEDNDDGTDDDEEERMPTLLSPFDAALTITERFLRHKIMQVATKRLGKRDGVGVLLYGTSRKRRVATKQPPNETVKSDDDEHESEPENNSDDNDDHEHERVPLATTTTHTFMPLEPPGIPHVKSIFACLPDRKRNHKRERNLQTEYGAREDDEDAAQDSLMSPLRSAFRDAVDEYWNAKCVNHRPGKNRPADTKSIWILTDDDDPCKGNEQEAGLIERATNDVMENNIAVHVLPLVGQRKSKFRMQVFWERVVSSSDRGTPTLDTSDALDLDELVQHLQAQWAQVRKQFSLPLLFPDWQDRPDDPGIMLDFFRPVSIQKKPIKKYQVNQETRRETTRIVQTIASDVGDIIPIRDKSVPNQPGDKILVKFAEFGGEQVLLDPAEVRQIKKESNAVDRTSLLLLGFRDVSSIPLHYTLDRSFFLFPNDESVKGSAAAFANLHAAMLRKKVLAVCEFVPRATSTARLVAMYPQREESEEQEDASSLQLSPPGFILIELPFQTEIRVFGEDSGSVEPTEESVVAAMELMRKLKLKNYIPGSRFENHAIAQFWNYIEAVALGTEVTSAEEYEPLMDDNQILAVAGERIASFQDSLPQDIVTDKPRKRKTLVVQDDSGLDWRELYRTGALQECKVAQLKQFLKSKGQRVSGKKEELLLLVKRILQEDAEKANGEES